MPFVLASSAEQIDEEQRLLYVGITRARRLLRISWSRTRNGNGHPRTASRFLQPVLPESLQAPVRSRAAARRSRHSALSLHCRSCGRSLTDAAERKIGRHLGCPATYDERTMAMLKEWRRQEAADAEAPGLLRVHRCDTDRHCRGATAQPGGFDQGPGARSGPRPINTASTCWRSSAPKPTVQDHLCNISRLQATSPMREREPTKFPQKSAKKVFASVCDTPLGLTRTFTLGRAEGRYSSPRRTRGGVRCSLIRLATHALFS